MNASRTMLSLQGTSIQLTKGTFPYKKRCTPNLYPVSVQSPSGSLQRICRNYPGLGVKCTQAVSAEQASTSVADDVNILGIDIGGQTVKAAVVDVSSGKIISQKLVVVTPNPATPEAVAVALKQIVDHFNVTLSFFLYIQVANSEHSCMVNQFFLWYFLFF